MPTTFNWERDLFDDTYKIYSDTKPVGFLKTGSGSTYGQINGKSYLFNTLGTSGQTTLIYDAENYEKLGEIRLNDWMNKATIIRAERFFSWKSKDTFNNKHSMSDTEFNSIYYSSSSMGNSGNITANFNDDLLILTGLTTESIAKRSRNIMLYLSMLPLIVLFLMWLS